MKLTERIHLVGSGGLGFHLTDAYDCNIYLLDAGSSAILIDSGAGLDCGEIARHIELSGFALSQVSHLFVTHAHADHSGGAAELQRLTGAQLICSPLTAEVLRSGDEARISLDTARSVGVYPQNYRWNRCEPNGEFAHGQRLKVGDVTLEFIAAPGHSFDLTCCYVHELRALFCSDMLFAGGMIAALPTWDFSLHQLGQSMERLSSYEVDGLFPGHLSPLLQGGGKVIETARDQLAAWKIPRSIV